MEKVILSAALILGCFIIFAVILQNNFEQGRYQESLAREQAKEEKRNTCLNDIENGVDAMLNNRKDFCQTTAGENQFTDEQCDKLVDAALNGAQKKRQDCYERNR